MGNDIKKNLTIWFAVNKSGFIGLYAEEPKRNEETGQWDSKMPFVNAYLYKQIVVLVQKANMSWANEPECIIIEN